MAESQPTEVGASRAAPAASRRRGGPSRCASRRVRGPCQPVDATGVPPIRADCPDTSPRPRAASLVALERQRVVAAFGHDRRRGAALRAHRVRRHRAPLHVDQLQQLRQRRDLVRLAVHLHLRQGQFRLRRERLQQVRRRPFRGVLERPRSTLPSTATTSPRRSAQSCARRSTAFLQARRVQHPEQPRERVVARNPVRQRHELPQPGLPDAPEVLHVDARASARQHRQQRDRQRLVQVVAPSVAAPRVLNVLKNRQNLTHPAFPSLDRSADSALSSSSICPCILKYDCPAR